MIKFFITILLTALLAFACGLYLPWWSVALAASLVAYFIYQPPLRSFLTGFCAALLLWVTLILIINSSNHYILVPKISMIIGLGGPFLLMLLSSVIGALTAGLGALTGTLLRRIFLM